MIDYAAQQPGYAGAFIDQLDKGQPVFLFTKGIDARRAEIGMLLPAGTRYDVRKVDQSLAELTGLKDRVTREHKALYESGVTVVSSTVDVVNNRVEVGVLDRDERKKDTVKSVDESIAVVGEAIPVADTCTITSCPNLKGGLHIHQTSTVVGACTSGFLARRYDTNPDQLVMVTAGHCIAGKTATNWKHDGTTFGGEVTVGGNLVHGWKPNSKADVGIIKIWEAHYPDNKNKFLSKPAAGQSAAINGSLTWTQQVVGTQVCRIGWGSATQAPPNNPHYTARKCGLIHKYDTDVTQGTDDDKSCAYNSSGVWKCKIIKKSKKVDFDSWGGDSGGIIFENNYPNFEDSTKLLGTHVHSEDGEFGDDDNPADRGWYSTHDNASDQLDDAFGVVVLPCYTSSCGF